MPPRNRVHLEQEVIAAIFGQPDRFPGVRRALRPERFADPWCKKVVGAIHECAESGYVIDSMNVASIGKLSAEEAIRLLEIGTYGADLSLLKLKLTEAAIMDRIEAFRRSDTTEADPFELLKKLNETANACEEMIAENTRPDKLTNLTRYSEYLLQNAREGVKRIPTGIRSLDLMLTGGWSLGDMTLLGGTPGSGKTSLMLSCAYFAARHGIHVAFLEGEMPMTECFERLNGIHTGQSIDAIRAGKDFDALSREFVSDFYSLPLELTGCYERTVDALTSSIRAAVSQGAQLIFVDYLQVFSPKGRAEDEFSKIKLLSESLRKLALQNGVHLFVASSLNRSEAGGRLTLNSFYGSSQLGHDCSVALLLEGEQQDTQELVSRERTVTLRVTKNRSGARGAITLRFFLSSQRFEEVGYHAGQNDKD